MSIQRSLEGLSIGISISESADASARGFSSNEVNRTVLAVSEALIAQGARLVFGHDWREGGVMDAIFDFALRYTPATGFAERDGEPLISNFIAAPDKTSKTQDELDRYRGTLQVIQAGQTDGMFMSVPQNMAGADKINRALALTSMRERMTEVIDARICLGGRTSGSGGRCAGIVEEAYLALQHHKALYISGLLGGASSQVIAALAGERSHRSDAFQARRDIAAILRDSTTEYYQPEHIRRAFEEWGVGQLCEYNCLSHQMNLALFDARQRSKVIELVIRGLKSLKASKV